MTGAPAYPLATNTGTPGVASLRLRHDAKATSNPSLNIPAL